MKEVSDKICRFTWNTFHAKFFFFLNKILAIYETIMKSMAEPDLHVLP